MTPSRRCEPGSSHQTLWNGPPRFVDNVLLNTSPLVHEVEQCLVEKANHGGSEGAAPSGPCGRSGCGEVHDHDRGGTGIEVVLEEVDKQGALLRQNW